jgi:hypothetical protein
MLTNQEFFLSQEIKIIDNFISKITNPESTEIFLDVLNNFKSEIDGLNLSKENYAKFVWASATFGSGCK